MKKFQTKLAESSPSVEIESIQDFEMVPGIRRAKIVMQTAAHVSGAAYFYDQKLITQTSVTVSEDLNNNNQVSKKVSQRPNYTTPIMDLNKKIRFFLCFAEESDGRLSSS